MPYRLTRPNGQSLVLYAATRITMNRANRVTEHPVERGVAYADHIQVQALEVGLSVIFTETPLASQSSTGGPGHVARALRFLEEAQAELLVLSGPRLPGGVIGNLALLTNAQEITQRRDVSPTLRFRQIQIAEVGSVNIAVSQPVNNEVTDPDTGATTGLNGANELADETDAGEQPTETVPETDPEAEENKSTLRDWVDWFGG